MKIKYNNLELFDQGTLICEESSEIEFEIRNNVFVQFKFDYSTEEQKINAAPNANKLIVTFHNFQDGTSFAMYPVGKIGNTQYLLSATTLLAGQKGSLIITVHYNWYKKEINNG